MYIVDTPYPKAGKLENWFNFFLPLFVTTFSNNYMQLVINELTLMGGEKRLSLKFNNES